MRIQHSSQAGMDNHRVNTKNQFCRILALLVRRLPAPTPPLYWVSGASAATHSMCSCAWVHCVFMCVCARVCACRQELFQHSTDLGSPPNIGRRIRLLLAIIICHIHVCVRHFSDSGRIVSLIAGPKYVDFVAYS